jgi:hypothetical protein
MEHQTGPDGTDAAAAAAVGVPQSVPGAVGEVWAPAEPREDSAAEAVREIPVAGAGRDVPVVGAAQADPVPATGEPRVDAALKLLDRLPGLPVSEHSELFEQVHAQLSDVLGELDFGPAGPASG